MISVPGYTQITLIHQGLHNLVYAANRARNGDPVILRQLRPELASPQLISRTQKEYDILSGITSDFVIKPIELIETLDSLILVTERPEGRPLIELIDEGNIPVQEATIIGCLIAKAIDDLHRHNVIHKDINPANIVYNAAEATIKLIDFGISSILSPSQMKPEVNRSLEGTLAYLSPEQTGRMNRSVDFRSDFYSFGVTLYQLLTGKLPFTSVDGLELIYDHMASKPQPPEELNPSIPSALSKVTMKLLSKMPEERYQSAYAIIRDIDRVIDLANQGEADVDFEVALDDISDQLNISEKLLDRDAHLVELLTEFEQVSKGGTSTIICLGESGVGKTALIRELEREVIARGGYLAKGTHTPLTVEVPYSAVTAALDDLVRQIASKPILATLRESIRKQMAGYEEPMLSLVPELASILDLESGDVDVPSSEAKPKLIRGILGLLNTVCNAKTPLVISLDNLHWIDRASLELFDDLFGNDQAPYVMLLGAYRSFALGQNDPNRVRIQTLLDRTKKIQLLRLENFSAEAVNRMVSESLFRSEEETFEFAKLVQEKTAGNPLAVKEFLGRLLELGHLYFDQEHREWVWDIQEITNQPPSENVSLSLINQLQDLDEATIKLLQIGSCIGVEFDLELLQVVAGLSFAETSSRLSVAIQKGYLLQQSSATDVRDKRVIFRFAHERVQQTAYSMLETRERRQIHASIGQSLLETARGDLGNRIFDVVNQLNNSFETPESSKTDQLQLAELNLTAGYKAKNAAAFQQAFKYFKTAIALLGQNAWVQYDKALELHLEAARTAYLCGDDGQLDTLITSILDHSHSAVDTAEAYDIKIRSLIANHKLAEASATAITALRSLDVELAKPLGPGLLRRSFSVLLNSWRLSANNELSLPPMTDERYRAAMKLLMILCHAAYMSSDPKISRYVLEMAYISLKHGMAPESSFAFPALGAVFITFFGTIDFGYRLGQMSLNNLGSHNRELHCRAITLAHNFNLSWKDHLAETLEPLSEAYKLGMNTNDVEYAMIAAATSSANAFVLGQDLNSIEANLQEQTNEAQRHQQIPMYYIGKVYLAATRNLLGDSSVAWLLEHDDFSENELLQYQELKVDDSALANLFLVKMYIAMLFNRPDEALSFAQQVHRHMRAILGTPAVPFFTTFEALAAVKSLSGSQPLERIQLIRRVKRNLRRLRKWSRHAPSNFLHRYHLVEAEYAAFKKQELKAIEHFEQAISLAQSNRYLNDLAYANEQAGRFYLRNNKRELALYYLTNALSNYKRWGAANKVMRLQAEFTELTEQTSFNQPPSGFMYSGDRSLLDLESVMKASQVLAGEIVLENLLERLMQLALINAGGHKASLVLRNENHYTVEITTWTVDSAVEYRFESMPLEQSAELPVSVIQYVARTQEDLVLNDAVNEDIFTQDEYILRQKPKSILCIPILTQSHLTGVLYVENTNSTHAFTQDRVSVLKLLASQSAIAIENSKLYQQLNDSRNRYLSLYQNAVEGIFEVDEGGEITNINPAAAHLLGYDTVEELRTSAVPAISASFLNPNDFDEFRRRIGHAGRVLDYETQLLTKTGTPVWVAMSGQVITDQITGKYKLEGAIVDISERKLREDAEQARVIAEASAETKSQFLANMSHEIRTPMNAIIGYTDLALDTPLNEEQSEYISTIRKASNHLLRVVNDILDLSKVESGKLQLDLAPFRLSTVFDDLNNLFGLAASQKSIRFTLPQLDKHTEAIYLGDSIRLGQVLINLVGNAIKFTDEGSIEISFVEEQLAENRTLLSFRVKDSGCGIEPSQIESIFETFSQSTTTTPESGTGLGLSISRRLAEAMGGELTANSLFGKGSTFYFSAVVENQPADVADSLDAAPDKIERRFSTTEILLVEDNEINQNLATRMLERVGLSVTIAENGLEALNLLRDRFIPLILMDIRMPVMGGIETIKQIRSDSELSSAYVIALSAGVLDSEVQEAMDAGFDDYLTKPVDFDALTKLLGDILGAEEIVSEQSETQNYVIRGVNFSSAIDSHGGDLPFLVTLTGDFINIYGKADEELRAHLAASEQDLAERLAHNIAGLSGTFGADNLMKASREVEHALINNVGVTDENLQSFTDELGNFVAAIQDFQTAHGDGSPA